MKGHTNKVIARTCDITKSTVSCISSRSCGRSRQGIGPRRANWALEHGYVTDDAGAPSVTASIAGAGRASGSPCSRRSPARPASLPRCRSTVSTSKRIVRLPGQGEAFVQAIGNSRGGRTTKIHVVADAQGRSLLILLTPGNASDMAPHRCYCRPCHRSSAWSPIADMAAMRCAR